MTPTPESEARAPRAGAPLRRGLLFIVSAPSGTGKTTLVTRLVERLGGVVMSRSYTSRPPRAWESDGVDYNFIEKASFERMIDDGAFLEWADVFGQLYGTAAADTERHRVEGRDVVLIIDVQGARQVRQRGDPVVGVFVLPPSFSVLEARLRARSGGDVDETHLRRRLETARREVEASREYDFIVVNNDLDACVDRVRSIVVAERAKREVVAGEAAAITDTFRE